MKQTSPHARRQSQNVSHVSARTFGRSRGFSLVEMLIALAICAALLVAVLSALVASFRAYQATTEQASTHVVGRIVMHRMMALVRNGVDFGPLPEDARDRFVLTDQFLFVDDDGREIQLRLDRGNSALLMRVDEGAEQLLLEGVRGPTDEVGASLGAFTLEYENGTKLVRASFDLTVEADDNASLTLEGDEVIPIRLVGSTAPRRLVW
jgi:prepilin-type N-terminal cleavage/methylation domain-containing protein